MGCDPGNVAARKIAACRARCKCRDIACGFDKNLAAGLPMRKAKTMLLRSLRTTVLLASGVVLAMPAFAARGPLGLSRPLTTEQNQIVCDSETLNDDRRLDACEALIASGDSSRDDLAVDYVQRGNIAYRRHAFSEAVASYNQAIALVPDIAAAYYDRGLAYAAERDFEKAVADYDTALTYVADIPVVLLARADSLASLQRYDAALADVARLSALHPNDPDALNAHGAISDDMGKPADAIADYNKVLALKPDFVDAFYNRALAYAHDGKWKEGQADMDRYVALKPNSGDGWFARAFDFDRDAPERAIADYTSAARDPDFEIGALYMRGALEIKLGRQAAGTADMAAAEKKDPNVVTLYAKFANGL
jgi:tetratricopeptide (TPR) repeat protein